MKINDFPGNNGGTPRVLRVDASGRYEESATRTLASNLIDALRAKHGELEVTTRDLAQGLPFVNEAWISANFTPDEERTESHQSQLAYSDSLVGELRAADVLVIGVPIYNFGVPAALKAWVDMVARARLTFRYTANGPIGLLEGKKAYLIVASGGVPVDSAMDFATPYMRHALGFLGVTDVEVISAEQLNSNGTDALSAARARIADLVYTTPAHTAVSQAA